VSIVLSTILSLSAIYSGIGVAKADSVIATVPVGAGPYGIASDSTNGDLYVTNHNDNTTVGVRNHIGLLV
jgi:DNA-binding beta-propeller fold protein YncE